jgi:hypothetical protein
LFVVTTPNNENRTPQFSLRSLLWFVVACSAYFSMLSATSKLLASRELNAGPWLVTVFVTWLILFFFLHTKGVRGMLTAHFIGPAVGVLLLLPPTSIFIEDKGRQVEPLLLFAMSGAAGCFVSSLISFPASVLRMVVLALRRK